VKYEIEVDGKSYEVESDTALAPAQIAFYAQKLRAPAQQQAQPPQQEPGTLKRFGQGAARMVGQAADFVDRFTGAPIRAGLSAAQDVASSDLDASTLSQVPRGLISGLGAAASQFGGSTEGVPSSKQLFERAGFSGQGSTTPITASPVPGMAPGFGASLAQGGREGFSPAGMMGFGLDVASPVPGVGVVKAGAKATGGVMRAVGPTVGKAVSGAAEGVGKTADALTGTKAGTGAVEAVGKTLDAARKKAADAVQGIKSVYGNTASKDWDRWRAVAEKNGIDPETLPDSFKYGKHSIASRLERYNAQDDIMGEALRDKWQGSWNGIQEALGRKVDDIAGGPGIGYGGAPEAGARIRKVYDTEVDKVFSDLEDTYRGVANKHPQMFLPPASRAKMDFHLNRIEAYAQDLVKNSADKVSKAQGSELLETIAAARGKTNFGELVTAMQGIGRSAFKNYGNTGAILPPDVAKLRQMYHGMSEAAVDAVRRQVGGEAADALIAKNAKITEVASDKNVLKQMGLSTLDDGKLFEQLTRDPMKIRAMKKYLDPETLKASKAAYLRELMTDRVNGEGTLSFKQLHNALRNRRHAVHTLFDPGELSELRDLVEMGSSLQPMMLSTSGTGSTIQTKGMLSRVGSALTSPLQSAGHLVDEALAARQKRAIGFQLPDESRAAAQSDLPPPIMGFGSGRGLLSSPMFYGPRKKALQVYGAQKEER
jgi:hypothetical protein